MILQCNPDIREIPVYFININTFGKVSLISGSLISELHCTTINLRPDSYNFILAVAVGTIVWKHHLNSNETHGEKARWELHENITCFESNIAQSSNCTATSLPSHKSPNKPNGLCWWNKDELITDVFLWTPAHGRARVGWSAKTNIYQRRLDAV